MNVLLIFSIVLNILLAGCCIINQSQDTNSALVADFAQRHRIDSQGRDSKEILESASQKITALEAELKKAKHELSGPIDKYYGSFLTEEDWKYIDYAIKPRPAILEKLKKYDTFMKQIKGKTFRVCPVK